MKRPKNIQELREIIKQQYPQYLALFDKVSNVINSLFFSKECYDFLMGVGAQYYPDESFFIEEAWRLGPAKRTPTIPRGLVPGKSKIFLVHWKTRKIFAYFVPSINLIVPDGTKDKFVRLFQIIERIMGKKVLGDGVAIETQSEARALEGLRYCGLKRTGYYVSRLRKEIERALRRLFK